MTVVVFVVVVLLLLSPFLLLCYCWCIALALPGPYLLLKACYFCSMCYRWYLICSMAQLVMCRCAVMPPAWVPDYTATCMNWMMMVLLNEGKFWHWKWAGGGGGPMDRVVLHRLVRSGLNPRPCPLLLFCDVTSMRRIGQYCDIHTLPMGITTAVPLYW